MKYLKKVNLAIMFLLFISISFFSACSDDNTLENLNDDITLEALNNIDLTQADKDAMLFMLEEEKLARDTYKYLYDLWEINMFTNIKNSEQSHMNAVESLLILNNVAYAILPEGQFANQDLQNLYNQFVDDGKVNEANALQIGATIEDLDIVDLQDNINETANTAIIAVFESLQCGSRNHLRSFVSAIENIGNDYVPQFLTQEEYNLIINNSHEQCN